MTEKNHIYDSKEFLEQLKKENGLPENIATEAQLWDEIFKKEVYHMPRQIFPLIYEIYGKRYPPDSALSPLATEFSVNRNTEEKMTSIRADKTILIDGRDIYHFECEIKGSNAMVLRMFEYDVHIALSYPPVRHLQERKALPELRFPRSCVLYLQGTSNRPPLLSCRIYLQDGTSCPYKVPILQVQSYTLKEIKEKHLFVLIPFLPLRFRKYYQAEKKSFALKKEELTSFYRQIILILSSEADSGQLTDFDCSILLNLLRKSMIRVFCKDDILLKEVISMTEPILELEIDKYIKSLSMKMDELEQLKIFSEKLDHEKEQLLKETERLGFEKDFLLKEAEQLGLEKDFLSKETERLGLEKDFLSKETERLGLEKELLFQENKKKDIQIAELKKQLLELQA